MTNGELIDMLIRHANEYSTIAQKSISTNWHLNGKQYEEHTISVDDIDAVLADFLNFIGVNHGMDLALHANDIKEYRANNPEWKF